MKNNLNKIQRLLLIIVLPASIYGQTTINSSGGSHRFSGVVYEYSIGEMTAITTETGDDIIVTQGLLQVEDISLTIVEESLLIQGLIVYPNPTKGQLFLKPSLGKPGKLSVRLYDLLGGLVLDKTFYLDTGLEEQELDLSFLSEATYMLNVEFLQDKKRYHNSYKILKYGN